MMMKTALFNKSKKCRLSAICIVIFLCISVVFSSCAKEKTSIPEETNVSDETTIPDNTANPVIETTTQKPVPVYPTVLSQSGTYHNYQNGYIRVDNAIFSICGYTDSVASSYAALVTKTAGALIGKTCVYCLLIPTADGIIFPDDIKENFSNLLNQEEIIDKVFSKMSAVVYPVRCYDNLMAHRDEYLYFRTDHHWNGKGAYYAYEAFCETKNITPYTLNMRKLTEFDGFVGTLYSNANKDSALLPGDTVEAYHPYCSEATIKFTDQKGNTYDWEIISDVSTSPANAKYNTFAASDSPYVEFTNTQVTDNSVLVIVKDSYGNAIMPFLADHYSKIYEIDYRYWSGNVIDLCNEVNATDLIFESSIMLVSAGSSVGQLSMIIE
ncbi:MAG TPA: hypothetical protein GXZ23_00385 [Clostridiales bacterium]|nr:hypothetical protein [Clostridiales bacterium]